MRRTRKKALKNLMDQVGGVHWMTGSRRWSGVSDQATTEQPGVQEEGGTQKEVNKPTEKLCQRGLWDITKKGVPRTAEEKPLRIRLMRFCNPTIHCKSGHRLCAATAGADEHLPFNLLNDAAQPSTAVSFSFKL